MWFLLSQERGKFFIQFKCLEYLNPGIELPEGIMLPVAFYRAIIGYSFDPYLQGPDKRVPCLSISQLFLVSRHTHFVSLVSSQRYCDLEYSFRDLELAEKS